MTASLTWWNADSEVLPTAAPNPWTFTGAASLAMATGAEYAEITAAAQLGQLTRVFDAGASRVVANQTAFVDVQFILSVPVAGGTWGGGSAQSGALIFLSDGAHAIGVAIGTSLAWIDPSTGVLLRPITSGWPSAAKRTYRLRKEGRGGYELLVDGVVTGRLSDQEAAGATSFTPTIGVGVWNDNVGSAYTVRVYQLETGVNATLPPQHVVERLYFNMPIAMQNAWSERSRALLRAVVAIFEPAMQALRGAHATLTAERQAITRFAFSGTVLPSATIPAWTETGATWTVYAQRVRLTKAGAGAADYTAAFASFLPSGSTPAPSEMVLRGFWRVVTATPDAQGRVGPIMRLRDGTRSILAALVDQGSGRYGWTFTTAAITGALVEITGRYWPVNPWVDHEVELRRFGEDVVVLIVNGEIVDRAAWSAFSVTVAEHDGSFIHASNATGVVELSQAVGEVTQADLSRRPLLETRALETNLALGGCERNDELETWRRCLHGVMRLRGTTRGILVEVSRIACDLETSDVVFHVEPSQWFLEKSWPGITPTYIGVVGVMTRIYVEFSGDAPLWTPQQAADWMARYLVPTSCEPMRYAICRVAVMTAPSVTFGGNTRLTVGSTTGFEAGDVVQVRDAAATVQETAAVVTIVSPTVIDITLRRFAYIAGDRLRKTLATT